jgi:hypothetical protein
MQKDDHYLSNTYKNVTCIIQSCLFSVFILTHQNMPRKVYDGAFYFSFYKFKF